MRKTEKQENGYYKLKKGEEIWGEENGIRLVQIVGEYEDIIDELGVDLIILSVALKQKFIYHDGVKIEILGLHIKSNELHLYGFVENTTHAVYLSLKDYGKTWSITKRGLL